MADLIQFVSDISASPTIRLDLNNESPFSTIWSAPPPPLRRFGGSASASRDGDPVSASSYGNRTIHLSIDLPTTTQDLNAASLQTLARILNEESAVLKYQPTGMTAPVFFRTLRADISDIQEIIGAAAYRTLDVSIPAEPFAVGLREDAVAGLVVTNNPAAGTRGMFFDTPTIKGDVSAPAVLWSPDAVGTSTFTSMFLAGEPSPVGSTVYFAQAESGTMAIADTTVQANDVLFSGAGSNWVRTTFATSAGLATRISGINLPSTLPLGEYHVYVRLRASGAGSFTVRADFGPTSTLSTLGHTDELAISLGTTLTWYDLGVVASVNTISEAVVGLAAITPAQQSFKLLASRTSGAVSLDFDVVVLVPTGNFTPVQPDGTSLTVTSWVFDGVNDTDFFTSGNASPFNGSSRTTAPAAATQRAGGPIMLTPNVVNRVHVLTGTFPTVTSTSTWSLSYWPRYLYVRPATT